MYKKSDLQNLIFFDIETVPEVEWDDLSDDKQHLWKEKYHYRFFSKELESRKKKLAIETDSINIDEISVPNPTFKEVYTQHSAVVPEFARVWCISFGLLDSSYKLTIHTLQEDNEKDLLSQWITVLNHYQNLDLSGFNINGFDIPFLLVRLWVNGLVSDYPRQLKLKDAKPWTVKHVDFMNDWMSCGKNMPSLASVCEALHVKTPKDKFNGAEFVVGIMNGTISKKEGIEYCEKDVKALVECMLKVSSDNCNYKA